MRMQMGFLLNLDAQTVDLRVTKIISIALAAQEEGQPPLRSDQMQK